MNLESWASNESFTAQRGVFYEEGRVHSRSLLTVSSVFELPLIEDDPSTGHSR
jgi:hypothetical protein